MGRALIIAICLLLSAGSLAGADSIVPPSSFISEDQARLHLARIYSWSGRYAEAERLFVHLIKDHPDDAQMMLDWAAMEAARGHAGASRSLFARALPLAKDRDKALLVQAQAMNLWGDFYRVERIYRDYLAKHPADTATAMALARVLKSSQRFEEAEAAYSSLLGKDVPRDKILAGLAELQREARNPEAVLRWTGELLKARPEDPLALRLRGWAWLQLGRYQEAYNDYLRLSGYPNYLLEGLVGMGRARLAQGQVKSARELFAQAHAAKPGDPLTEYFYEGASRVVSKGYLASLTKPGSLAPSQLVDWARMYLTQGHPAAAVECYRAALAADKDFFPARLGLAEALAADRKYDEANKLLADLARQYPGVSKILLTQARVLAWSRRYKESINAFRAMHKLNPTDPLPLHEGARAAAWGKDMDLAWDLYQQVLTPPVDQKLAGRLGTEKVTMSELAGRSLKEILEKAAPKHGARQANAYQAYEELNAQWPEMASGFGTRDRAVVDSALKELQPYYRVQKAAYLESRGKQALWNRRFAQAGEIYQELTTFTPGNQEAWFDLAQADCALGLCDRAASAYRRLLSLDPLHNQASLALQRSAIRQSPRLGGAWSYWREDGRGEAARITRQRAEMSLAVPVLCRFQLKAAGLAWWERPQRWGGEAEARGFSLEAGGPFNAYVSASVGWTHKDYNSDDYADRDSGFGEVWFNLHDFARLGLGWQREDLIKNAFSLRTGTQVDIWWLGLTSWLTRRLEAAARIRYLDYSDGNQGHWENLTLSYLITDHPRELKVVLDVSYRETEDATLEIYEGSQLVDMRYPYWTPQDWLGGMLSFVWRHDISREYFCGATQHYYDLRLNLGAESKGNPGAGLEALWHWEFAKRWDLEARAMTYRSREWDADGLWLSLGYRF